MKKFTYQYSDLQHDILTNSDRTNLKTLSGGLENFVPPDDILEDAIVPEITYTATNATSVDKTVKAWTFYCDSLSGCVEGTGHYEDGDGSIENPWRSLEFALKQIQQKLTCWRNVGCFCFRIGKYFQLKVKGSIDYTVTLNGFDGAEQYGNEVFHQFIIAPWNSQNLLLNGFLYGVRRTIFNHLEIHTETVQHDYQRPLEYCNVSLFNHFKIIETPHNFAIGIAVFCDGSKFIDVTLYAETYNGMDFFYIRPYLSFMDDGSEIIGLTSHNVTVAYKNNNHIYNANVNIRDESSRRDKDIVGFVDYYFDWFGKSYLYNCSANVSGTLSCEPDSGGNLQGYVDAIGFYHPWDETIYYNCTTSPHQCEKCKDSPHICLTPDF